MQSPCDAISMRCILTVPAYTRRGMHSRRSMHWRCSHGSAVALRTTTSVTPRQLGFLQALHSPVTVPPSASDTPQPLHSTRPALTHGPPRPCRCSAWSAQLLAPLTGAAAADGAAFADEPQHGPRRPQRRHDGPQRRWPQRPQLRRPQRRPRRPRRQQRRPVRHDGRRRGCPLQHRWLPKSPPPFPLFLRSFPLFLSRSGSHLRKKNKKITSLWRRGFCVTGLEKKTWPSAAALADIAEIYRIHRKVCKEQCWWGACRIRRRSCRR